MAVIVIKIVGLLWLVVDGLAMLLCDLGVLDIISLSVTACVGNRCFDTTVFSAR
jgi:hypothetical protein